MTPAELSIMAKAKQESEWNHTSALLAIIHNALAKKAKSPDDFHPMRAKAKQKTNSISVSQFAKELQNGNTH